MKNSFDVVVVGAGPGGYVAAIRCAQLGLRTVCIDQWVDEQNNPVLGGTCLNVGCIPSKALLDSSHKFEAVNHEFKDHGIHASQLKFDLSQMMARKSRVVKDLTQGVASLFKANGVAVISGTARLLDNSHVEVTARDGAVDTISAKHIILASGSKTVNIDAAPYTDDIIVDSSGALEFDKVPKRLGIIGGGVIGLEMGSVWRRLGSEVLVLEAQDSFLPMVDEQVSREALRQFKAQGLDIRLGARVVSSEIKRNKVNIEYVVDKSSHTEVVDKLIVAVGRQPNTHRLFADESQLLLDEWGYIHVNSQCQTNLPGVYAIGDVIGGPMLAHKASEEGMMVAELIAGHHAQVNYATIPSVIYTHPEIAWVGKSEQMLKSQGVKYRSGSFPFAANGRAQAQGDTAGFVKILADSTSDRILGVHVIGANSSEIIAQAVIAMTYEASSEDLALTMFAHPTLSEALHEAALDVDSRAIHIAKKRKK